MTRDSVAELKAACAGQTPSAADQLRMGRTTWLMGHPAAAPEGTIAVSRNGDFKLIIRDEDVLEVDKHGDEFLVKVSAEANILVSFEKVIKADPGSCGCHETQPSPTLAREGGPVPDPDFDVNLINIGGCVFRWECKSIGGRRICFLMGFYCV
jgi:hypothetical protein